MLRWTGWACLALALLALWRDWAGSGEDGLALAPLGQRWGELHRNSLIGLQSGLENRVAPGLFFDYVLPVLELPAAVVAGGLGLVLLGLGAALRRRR